MSRFKKGQTVYDGRGDSMRTLVVAKVHKNPLIPLRQYTFEAPYDGFACGEQSIRATKDGRDLKLSECIVDDKETEFRINTMGSAKRTVLGEREIGFPNLKAFDSTRVDFRPSLDMCEWIRDYADGRLIIHVGSGQGHLVKMLKMTKAKVIGIEPNFNKVEWLKMRSAHDGDGWDMNVNEILEGTVERHKGIIAGLGRNNKAILLFARPKVYDFVKQGLFNMPKGMEALYIDVESKYDRLGIFERRKTLLKHEGVSEDSELVYSIVR